MLSRAIYPTDQYRSFVRQQNVSCHNIWGIKTHSVQNENQLHFPDWCSVFTSLIGWNWTTSILFVRAIRILTEFILFSHFTYYSMGRLIGLREREERENQPLTFLMTPHSYDGLVWISKWHFIPWKISIKSNKNNILLVRCWIFYFLCIEALQDNQMENWFGPNKQTLSTA